MTNNFIVISQHLSEAFYHPEDKVFDSSFITTVRTDFERLEDAWQHYNSLSTKPNVLTVDLVTPIKSFRRKTT